jgi:vitamin B12/bleomycin/antimicrobial peptide transport system ATP-binding/permease protein
MLRKPYLAPDERRLLSRFWQSASGFWRGPAAWRTWLLIALLSVTVVLQLLTQYRLNFWSRDFFNALARKDSTELWRQALLLVPIAAASLTLAIVSVWGRMTMQRNWREWLTNHLYDYWLGKDHDVQLRFMPGEHQTPEYRIAEDARIATDLPVDLTLGLLSSCLTAITFIGVLWSVGDSFAFDAFGLTVAIPGYLVLSLVAYSVMITVAMMFVARHLTHIMQESQRTEAELRSIGTHLRESGEGIAPPDGRKNGRRTIGVALKAVIDIWRAYCWQLMRMTVVTHTNTLLTPFIALLLCTPKFLAGTMSLGEVVQAAAAFVVVQGAFNWITDNYNLIAQWMSSANRVASLLLALDQIDGPQPTQDLDTIAMTRSDRGSAQGSPLAAD